MSGSNEEKCHIGHGDLARNRYDHIVPPDWSVAEVFWMNTHTDILFDINRQRRQLTKLLLASINRKGNNTIILFEYNGRVR